MKRRLLISLLSLLLCFSMLVGTTFAWFTDSVTSGSNIITSGSLDIEVSWSPDNQVWNSIEGDSTIFPQVPWEPGYTLVRYFKVVNRGSLALSYALSLTSGELGKLAEVIDVYSAPGAVALNRETVQSLLTHSGGISDVVNTAFFSDMLLPGDEAVFTVAIKMREEAGNQYMNQQLNQIVVKAMAIQVTYEKDSFDELYDQNAKAPASPLPENYPVKYYSSLADAIGDANNSTPGANGTDEKGENPVGVYVDDNNVVHVVLLKDIALAESLKPTADMTINLGGHVLSSAAGTAITVNSGHVFIDGRIPGSGIDVKVPAGKTAKAIAINKTATVTLEGGVIQAEGVDETTPAIHCRGTFNASNATIVSKAATERADGVSLSDGATANISGCDISAYSDEAKSNGVYIGKNCSVVIKDTSVKAYAGYTHDGSKYIRSSTGIYHSAGSTLTLNNCAVYGNIAGIQTYGTLYVDGGTYEGYGHGGFYFVGKNTTSYIQNATIREAALPAGTESNNGTNQVGFYAGTGSGNFIYLDNCDIQSNGDAFVLRGSSGESVYVSNSSIPEGSRIRIDSDTHKLYLGQGNNFTAANASRPTAVVETNEIYTRN